MGQPETATSSHQYLGEKGVSKIANKGNSQTKHTILGRNRGEKRTSYTLSRQKM